MLGPKVNVQNVYVLQRWALATLWKSAEPRPGEVPKKCFGKRGPETRCRGKCRAAGPASCTTCTEARNPEHFFRHFPRHPIRTGSFRSTLFDTFAGRGFHTSDTFQVGASRTARVVISVFSLSVGGEEPMCADGSGSSSLAFLHRGARRERERERERGFCKWGPEVWRAGTTPILEKRSENSGQVIKRDRDLY